MSNEWKVTTNYVNNTPIYSVYCTRRKGEVDHSGNREYISTFFTDRHIAEKLAENLNSSAPKSFVLTYGGIDAEGVDCENAISFEICSKIAASSTSLTTLHSALQQIARHHGYICGLTDIGLKCANLEFDGGDNEKIQVPLW